MVKLAAAVVDRQEMEEIPSLDILEAVEVASSVMSLADQEGRVPSETVVVLVVQVTVDLVTGTVEVEVVPVGILIPTVALGLLVPVIPVACSEEMSSMAGESVVEEALAVFKESLLELETLM